MRNPIRIQHAGAAHRIRYWLCAVVASILLVSPGCIEESAPTAGATASHADARAGTLAAATPGESRAPGTTASRSIESLPVVAFLGTSLTAGYGLPEDQAFPALIQQRIDAAGLGFRVVNAGVSGDTSAGGRRRLAWLLRLPISVLVLELGANDMLRGQPVSAMQRNLAAILDDTRAAHPDVRFVIAGMRAAPNLGRDYVDEFDSTYPDLANRYDARLIPFLLEDVAAIRRLNQADGIHPTAEGHALIADRVWNAIEPLLH